MAKDDRFIKVYSQGGFVNNTCEMYVDKVPCVNYLYVVAGYGAGMTPLLNADGKPVVTPIRPDYDE